MEGEVRNKIFIQQPFWHFYHLFNFRLINKYSVVYERHFLMHYHIPKVNLKPKPRVKLKTFEGLKDHNA